MSVAPRFFSLLVLFSLSFVLVTPALAEVTFNERKRGFYVKVTTPDEEPLEDVKISLDKVGATGEPFVQETNRKGETVFPFLAIGQYAVSAELEGYFIRKYKILTRGGQREIAQDTDGKLVPDVQEMPPVNFRGRLTHGHIHLVMMKVEDYEPPRLTQAPGGAPGEGEAGAPVEVELTLVEQGDQALALGDFGVAAEKYEAALEETPDDVDLRWKLSAALAEAGEYGAAVIQANKVLREEPKRKGVRLQMVEWMESIGQGDAVVPYLEQELELDPDNALIYRRLVSEYRAQGQNEKAESMIETWVERLPDDSQALVALAMVRSKQGKLAEAEQLFQQVAEKSPEEADTVFFNIGALTMAQAKSVEDRRRAIAAFEKAIEINPDNARAHLELAYALVGVGRKDDAVAHLEKFIELAPNDARAGEAKGMLQALGAS